VATSAIIFGALPQASAATSTVTVDHNDVTSVQGALNKTYYAGPTVGSNSTSHWFTAGDIAEIAFEGHTVELYGRTQTNSSTATVYVDDEVAGEANYKGATTNNKLLLTLNGLTDGPHTLRIEPNGWTNHQRAEFTTGVEAGGQHDDLPRLLERYSALTAADYTIESWSEFVPVLEQAQTVGSTSTDAAERTAAGAALEAAAGRLVMISGLRDVIADYETRDAADYTAESWGPLQDSLAAARSVATSESASIASVVSAKNALQDAAAGLTPVDGGEFHSIQNDAWWYDTDGNPIYSQGGGVFKFGDTYYWYGVEYTASSQYYNDPARTYSDKFAAITVYSSTDLVDWKFENRVATTATKLWIPESTDVNGDYFSRMRTLDEASWMGRLGVTYNENTGKYVLLIQFKNPYDDPSADPSAGVLFLQGDSPTDDFEYANLQPSIDNVGYYGTGDQTVFTDLDGTDYLVFSNRFGRANGYVSKISDTDSLSIEPAARVWPNNGGREGNAMFRLGDTYYMGTSDLHGWNSSVTHMVQSNQIQGAYSPEYVLPGTESDYSHVTQTGFFITVHGTRQDTVIFAGDRWADFAWNGIGYNQWMPLSERGDGLFFNSLSNWELNAVTGEWRVGKNNNYVLNPDFAADRVGVTSVTGWTKTVDADSASTSFVANRTPGAESTRWAMRLGSTQPFSGGVSQTIEVPDGVYRFALEANTAGGLSYARATVTSGTDEKYSLDLNAGTNGWQEFSLDDLVLTGDPVTVSIEARSSLGGQYVSVDLLSLVPQEVDKSSLASLIAGARELDVSDYASGTWMPLLVALDHATAVESSPAATQAQVDEAADVLDTALEGLQSAVISIDASASKTTYEVGEDLDSGTLAIVAVFADGVRRQLSADEYSVSGFTSSSPGTVTIAVAAVVSLAAQGAPAVTGTFEVVVLPSWTADAIYVAGNQVVYADSVWEASWWTRNQQPGDPYGPWQQLATDDMGKAVWTASRIFVAGDRVTYDGRDYVAKWWTRNQRPGDMYGPWQPIA
jgi:chitodextrinase